MSAETGRKIGTMSMIVFDPTCQSKKNIGIEISRHIDIMKFMDKMMIFKALSNETRVQILEWLKEPDKNFGPQLYLPQDAGFKGGICVGSIQEKTGLAQSVVSSYLMLMKKAGLLESRRYGQWTYYRRNEETLMQLAEFVKNDL